MNIVDEAIAATLKTVVGGPEAWLDPEKGILTRFVNDSRPLRKKISLKDGEEPIFEYASDESYSLITSKRVISCRKDELIIKNLTEIQSVLKFITTKPFEKPESVRILEVTDLDQNEFLIEFDPGIPAYFAQILIMNLVCQIKYGRWFLNPSS